MKKKWLTKKRIISLCIALLFLILAFILSLIRKSWINEQDAQQMAQRWNEEGGVSQISCFFSREASVSENQVLGFEHTLDNVLKEASIQLESQNEGARLWADAYSVSGSVTISSERTSLSLKALGVGGDFFLFHPQKLLYGTYFSGSDMNSDYVVIDEETAWQLFGGIDVAGKFVTIGGQPHVISGVIQRPKGRAESGAGLEDPIVYTSLKTLRSQGNDMGLEHYEIVMPNPIKGFAMQSVKENLFVDEREVIFIENTGRFQLVNCLKVLTQYGYRSMNGKAIIYPYWENLARRCEDRLALLSFFWVLSLMAAAVIFVVWAVYDWRHRSWSFGKALTRAADFVYSLQSKWAMRKEKQNREKTVVVFDEEEENEKEGFTEGREKRDE